MSLQSVTYPEVFAMSGAEGNYVGYKTYPKNGNNTYNFTGATYDTMYFQLNPKIDETTRPYIIHLQDLSDGIDLKIEYYTDRYSSTAALVYGNSVLVDHRTQEVIDDVFIDGVKYLSGTQGFQLLIPIDTGDMSQLPYVPVRYYPSQTQYSGSGGEIHLGDEATSIYPAGTFITTTLAGVHPMDELSGECGPSVMINHPVAGSLSNIKNLSSDEDLDNLIEAFTKTGDGSNPVNPVDPDADPFKNDTSHPGGGKGSYTPKGDQTGLPGLPSSGVLSSGFIAMYNPTIAQLQSLGAKLWSDDFVESILKLWNDPMEAIITLGLVPFAPTSSGATNCQIGNYDTEVSMARVTSQYMTKTCGSVTIEEFWGNALDYAPYTEAEMFIPFVGMKKIDIDDIMGKTVSIDYNIDLLGGEAVAYVSVDNRVLYDFRCNLMSSVPISSSSYASLYSGILRAASSLAVGAAAGGVVAAAGGLTSAVNVMTSKHSSIERGSDLTPNAGVLGLLMPYIILHRPVQSLPSNFGHFKGYPSNITRTLSGVSGYTEVEYIHLDGISATDAEKEEIYTLLKDGVIL